MVPYVVKMGLAMLFNNIEEISQWHDQRSNSHIILDPIKLTIKSNYYKDLVAYKIWKG